MIGSPTVVADITLPGATSQLAARLLDVAPDGQQRLVARGHWRPEVSDEPIRQVFQLHPNAWEFPEGHTIKLELLPADAPAGRPSNGQRAVTVANMQLRLPAVQRPGARGGFVKAPAAKFLPEGYELARDFAQRNVGSLSSRWQPPAGVPRTARPRAAANARPPSKPATAAACASSGIPARQGRGDADRPRNRRRHARRGRDAGPQPRLTKRGRRLLSRPRSRSASSPSPAAGRAPSRAASGAALRQSLRLEAELLLAGAADLPRAGTRLLGRAARG